MAKEMNEYSLTTDVRNAPQYSGCSEVAACYSEEFSRNSFDRRRRNPFHINYLERLKYPVCSPTLFKSIEKATAAPSVETEISLTACDIDESDIFHDETLDSEAEKTAQETISKFFEDASKDLFITPDKVTNSFLIIPEEVRADDISLSYTCDPSTLQHDIHLSTTWAQTNITFPSNLPEEVEAALTLQIKQDENELKLAKCRVYDSVCGKYSQDTQSDEWEINGESANKFTVSSQTILSFPETLPEPLDTLLSSYETFFEEIYTDIRMSMLKRQLFSEHYVSSPQFHSSSPLSMLDDTSPLQSGSSVDTPQYANARLRHYGSPMGDILSPIGISPIVKPSNTNRFQSKLDFVSSYLETSHSMSPSTFLQVKGAIIPSPEDGSHQRN